MLDTNHDFSLEAIQEGKMLLIDKPMGWTSFDVVNRIRVAICKHFNIKKLKIGHAGTLDPLATGLLILCTGKWTKKIDLIQAQEKGYTGSIRLGYTTPSYDLETVPELYVNNVSLDASLIEDARMHFLGAQQQMPPIFSAIKKEGKRAYDLARQGKEVELNARNIEIFDIQLQWNQRDEIFFQTRCSKGTYIRSLANDIGLYLGTGAYLSELRRVNIGDYSIENAVHIEDFLENFK